MLGIDVSKDTLACTLLDPQTQKVVWNRTVPNTASGINRLLRQTPNGETGLAKQGDPELRRLLYLAAQANLKAKDSPFKAQYEKERAKGLATTAALCAVARKLARLAWSLHKHRTPYDPNRVYQQNIPASP